MATQLQTPSRASNPLVEGGEKLLRPVVSVFNFLTEDVPVAAEVKDRASRGIEGLLSEQVERESTLRKQLPVSQRHLATGASALSAGLQALTAIAPGAPIDVLDVVSAGAAFPFTRFLRGSKLANKLTEAAKFDDADEVVKLVKKAHPEAEEGDVLTAMTNSLLDPETFEATGVSNQQMLGEIDNALFGSKGRVEEASFATGKREVFESLTGEGGAVRRDIEAQTQAQSIEDILEEANFTPITIKTDVQLDAATTQRNASQQRIAALEKQEVRSNKENQELATARFEVSQADVHISTQQERIAETLPSEGAIPDLKTNPPKDPIPTGDVGGSQLLPHTTPPTSEEKARLNKELIDSINSTAALNQMEEWKNLRPRTRSVQQVAVQQGLEKAIREGKPTVLTKISDEALRSLSPSGKKPTPKEVRQVANRFSRLLPPGKKQAKPIAGEPLTRFTTKDIKDYLKTFSPAPARKELDNLRRLGEVSTKEATSLHTWIYKGGRAPTDRGDMDSARMRSIVDLLGGRLRERSALSVRKRARRDVGK